MVWYEGRSIETIAMKLNMQSKHSSSQVSLDCTHLSPQSRPPVCPMPPCHGLRILDSFASQTLNGLDQEVEAAGGTGEQGDRGTGGPGRQGTYGQGIGCFKVVPAPPVPPARTAFPYIP